MVLITIQTAILKMHQFGHTEMLLYFFLNTLKLVGIKFYYIKMYILL